YGVGYDSIDVDACAARGVVLTNTPGVLTAATADLAFALLLALKRRVVVGDRAVREGRWRGGWADPDFLGRDVSGSTLGIVGFGRIGRAVAERAAAFEMRVLHHSRRHDGEGWCELDELLAAADAVSLHLPPPFFTTAPASSTRRAARSSTRKRSFASSSRAGSRRASTSSHSSRRCRESCSGSQTSS
ncbi:MAG: hypothetical protein E6G38_10985, partial [Actinobacteria bacterium]